MLLRSVTKNVKDQNWFAVALDFFMVVAGILIAFQINNWNEAVTARSDTQIYRQRLSGDLHDEESSRLARIAYYEQTRKHAERALLALQDNAVPVGEAFLIDVYQATQRWPYIVQRTTYDELLSLGIANAIPDVALRSELANLYISLEASKQTQAEPTPFRDELRRNMPHDIQKAIRAECSDTFRFRNNRSVISIPQECSPTFEPAAVGKAIDALHDYDDLDKDLTRHISILDVKLSSLRAHLRPIRELAVKMENEP